VSYTRLLLQQWPFHLTFEDVGQPISTRDLIAEQSFRPLMHLVDASPGSKQQHSH